MYDHSLLFLTGLTLIIAYDDLSKNKDATQLSTYPPPINDLNKYVAGNAVDREVMTCMRTKGIGGNSPEKTMWWKVDLGGVHSIHSVDILFKSYDGYERRQQGRFAGFSIYASTNGTRDNASQCYKDGPELPPLNFSTLCITSGRYVTFYNERLHDVTYPDGYENRSVYTELCEVTVYGCQASGVYGDSCTELCPPNCRDNVCHIQKGYCFGCKPGWTGTTCNTKCVGGRFGQNCKQQCSGHCRDNAVCNHVTVCQNGTYGNNCVYSCSVNCLNDSPCDKRTGQCNSGCKPGYTNALCNERCLPGYYVV
uniref:Multiple epidermal growth factor-like domains protein 6 n=1 Tax=Crassostrea virginica TaxID=6565 RepID=A0A8B8C7P1_CRAVI|nr:multiple epidermal growth factor-like domains protein 6 [Crassostrea virginica]XP_022311652.1 multiple epidermal growth factor-like domains protein 6 [Crassostrea virginica]XP_022311653.1 multiple epidermal growth factor-like domains protein 6 [Crassostrea virginica]XP_022311654.1 multiple epidermal growth factor-like domains protein 6 [Crassostrea virginica]XP_022311655.1 multiple epidermal growth factor-like domains protein 6 [Crassostrea virginica]XP_022311656.1 multiple epidermal growth